MQTKGFLGIDVSKGYSDFLLLDQKKAVMEEGFQLSDNRQGREQLKILIEGWMGEGMEELYCGVESTGGYENNWYKFLKGLAVNGKVHVARLNPRGVKAVSDASLTRTITDAVSAENIAVYLMSFPEKVDYGKDKQGQTEGKFKDGRQHYSYIRMQLKQKVQLSNQLEKLLYQNFSEMIVYCRHGMPGWLLQMLIKYPCATSVLKAGTARLSAIKGISSDKAEALLKKVAPDNETISEQAKHIIVVTAREILHKELLIKEEKAYLTSMHQQDPDVQLLNTIKCIGMDSAVSLMMEIEDVTKYASAKKLASNFGVPPMFKQSGDGTWGTHMSKQGSSEVRAILYMAAMSGIRCNPILKPLYARFRAKGFTHYQAMGVVMHKLLRIIYGVLKNKTKFNAATDEENIAQAAERQQNKKQEKKEEKKNTELKRHRYQSLSTDAPISRRNAQKRKKQITS